MIMPRLVESLARRLLNVDEIAVAYRIEWLITQRKIRKAWSLLQDILPKYCRVRRGIPFTLWPDDVYRPLYYLDDPPAFLKQSSFIVHCMGEHLEGLLKLFPGAHEKLPLGAQTRLLKEKMLPSNLADELLEFNELADIPAKHPSADPFLPSRVDVRSFTLREITLLFMMMRYLSISIFALLKRRGIHFQEEWKEFKSEWIEWDRVTKLYPAVIAARQHLRRE